jgi:Transposase IS116/IS110/IS902 family/Helix-turn-helix domain
VFRSGRDFSAWIGLVPKQRSSGGKDKLGSISRQGDRYLRSLFTAGALAVERMRRERHTGKHIAAELGISPATVSRILRRLGLNKLSALEPAEPIRRYEREHPGELIHLDIKKLGRIDGVGHRITGDRIRQSNSRGIGSEFVHVCIRMRLDPRHAANINRARDMEAGTNQLFKGPVTVQFVLG